MAGDWIPIRLNLRDHPKVLQLVELTGLDRFAVIGRLVCFWAWASDHSEDGFLCKSRNAFVTAVTLDASFIDALQQVGWCYIDDDGVRVPQWDAWLSDSAKKRATGRKRQALWRQREAEKQAKKSVTPKRYPRNAFVTSTEQNRRDDDVTSVTSSKARVSCEVILQAWNGLATRFHLREARTLPDAVRKKILVRLKEHPTLWQELEAELPRLGAFAREKRFVTLEFISRPTSLAKLLDGNYRDNGTEASPILWPSSEELRQQVDAEVDKLAEAKNENVDDEGRVGF